MKGNRAGNRAGPLAGAESGRGWSVPPGWLLVRDGGLAGRRNVLSRFFLSSLFCSSLFSFLINTQSEGCRVELRGALPWEIFPQENISFGNGQPWF